MPPVRLLVADDDGGFRELLGLVVGAVDVLELVGIAVDGLDAVRLAVERNPDVVLLDVEMPGLDGFEAASVIRRLVPRARVVLHSGEVSERRRERACALDLELCDKVDLERTIELLVAGRSRSQAA